MKKWILVLLFSSFIYTFSNAQKSVTTIVKFKIKNTSLLPKKVTLISYQPGDSGNGTYSITMLPQAAKDLSFKAGTKLYLADAKQVDVVMSGKRIDQDKPFMIVKKEDQGKTISL